MNLKANESLILELKKSGDNKSFIKHKLEKIETPKDMDLNKKCEIQNKESFHI